MNGADEPMNKMRKNKAERCWISLVFLIASNDWAVASPHYHPMEDAIAGKDVQRACRRGDITMLCRLENLQESELENLDPCLCSHLLYSPEMSASVPEAWLKYSPEVKFMLATTLVRWMGGADLDGLLSQIREGRFDGVDITIGDEAQQTETGMILQEMIELLDGNQKIISLTFAKGGFSERILSEIDIIKISFFTDFDRTESKQVMTIPKNKLLYGFSVADMWKDDSLEEKVSERCAEMTLLKMDDESEHTNKLKNILKKMQYAVEEGKMGGIHVRSITQDDTTGVCDVGSYPILHFIRSKMSRDREPFGNFADLDIVLSTGESQEVQFVLELDNPREDLKKLPCERVGIYRHPMDCTKFYHCSEYRATTTRFNQSGPYAAFLYKCPSGLVYDEKQGTCIWPSWSDPCRGSGELLPVPAKKFSCITPGFHVDPDNCKYFYYCSDLGDGMLEAFEFLCPSDLLGFDEKKLLCNWKWTVVECSGNGSDDKSTSSHKQMKTPSRYRTSKVLNLQYIPSLPFLNPFPESAFENVVLKNETLSQYNPSFQGQNQSAMLEYVTSAAPHTAPDSNNYISDKKLHTEKEENERKFGTAVWQRPLTNARRNDGKRNITDIRNVYSYQDNLGLNRAYLSESDSEPEKPFKGRITKLDLKGKNSQSSGPQLLDGKQNRGIPGERISGLNAANFKTTNEHNKDYNILENVENRVSNDEPETPSDRKTSPFMNVKCSKSLNKNREYEDVNTLGCTSEVSLTVKLNRAKDTSKYVLREDQITRSYQESQKISHLKIPTEIDATDNKNQNQENMHKSNQKSKFISSVENKERNASMESLRKIHKSDSFSVIINDLQGQTEGNVAMKRTDILRSKSAEQFSQTKPPLYYETEAEYLKQSKPPVSKNLISYGGVTELQRNQVVKSESMPIHFYPQGVLLNINLAHVNQIPPDVLLEVDYMLKKYMNEGRIDASLLGMKLNASVEKMTPEYPKDPEPEEITDMIRIIENIISTSDISEPSVTEKTYFPNSESDIVNNATTEYEIITTEKTSSKTVAPEYLLPQDELKNQIKHSKFQNNSQTRVQNVTKTRPFGRGRLFRKSKYPSIREQLNQQIRFRTSNSRDESKAITNNENPTDNLPLYTYPLTVSQRSDKAIRTSFNRLPIHHMSMPISSDNAIQTSVSQFNDRFTDMAHQEDKYEGKFDNHESTVAAENNQDQQDQYSKQQGQNPFVGYGLPIRSQKKSDQPTQYSHQGRSQLTDQSLLATLNKNDQQKRYLQSSVVDYDSTLIVQDKNEGQDRYFQHRGQISFFDHGLPIGLQNKNYQRNSYLLHEGEISFFDHGLRNKNDQPVRYPQNEDQISFVNNHGLQVTVQNKNAQQDRRTQNSGQMEAAGNSPIQEDRINIDFGRWNTFKETKHEENYASKSKESVSNFNSQKDNNLRKKPDEIRRVGEERYRYKNEDYETYTQSYPHFTTDNNNAYASHSRENPTTTDDVNYYDSHQTAPNFANEGYFASDPDGHVKNSFTTKNENFDHRHNSEAESHFHNEKDSSFSYKKNDDFQQNMQPSEDDGTSSLNTSNKQTRKRKKLRILVKKIADDESESPLSTDYDKREIEERISKNVLKSLKNRLQKHAENIELQIQYQGHVWNIPFVDNESDLSPTICTRPGLFQHPRDCNMFYECFWDKWLRRFTLHVFACPVRLVYDHSVRGCSRPTADSPCHNHAS